MLWRWFRRLLYALALLLLTVGMLVAHLDTWPARVAVRDVANHVLSRMFRGRLTIGAIRRIDLDGTFIADGVMVVDPAGRVILQNGTLTASPMHSLIPALRHRGDMPDVTLEVGSVSLFPGSQGDGAPSIGESFAPRTPSRTPSVVTAPTPGFHFPRLRLIAHRVHSELGGFPADVGGFDGRGRLDTSPLTLDVASAHASASSARTPNLAIDAILALSNRYVPPGHGVPARMAFYLDATADVNGTGVHCHLEAHLHDGDTSLRAQGCAVSRGVIDRASGQVLGVDVDLDEATLDQRGSSAWLVSLRGRVNGERVHGAGSLHGDTMSVDLSVQDLNLQRFRPGLPLTRIDGAVHFERNGNRFAVNTEQLHAIVDGNPIPPAHAEAHLDHGVLVLDQLVSEQVGLRVRGRVDIGHADHDGEVDVHLDDRDVRELPFLYRLTTGSIRGDVHVQRRAGHTHGTFAVHGRNLQFQHIQAGDADARGDLEMHGGAIDLDANLDASRVVANGVGPMSFRASVSGDPTRSLSGRAHVDATNMRQLNDGSAPPTGPTTADVRFRARFDPGAIRIDVQDSPIVVRGAPGSVRASVTIPRAAGHPLRATARLVAAGGSADVAIHGGDIRGTFHGFSLDWVGRALGTRAPLTGTLDGDLGLLTRATTDATGTLHWRHGRLPILGDFDLDVSVDHRGATSHFVVGLAYGPLHATQDPNRPLVHVDAHAVPPSTLGDLHGWIRGLRDSEILATHTPAALLESILPAGTRVGGGGDVAVRLRRRDADDPLEAVVGFDLRNLATQADLSQRVPTILQDFVRRSTGPVPLHEPARLRGAVCARVNGGELLRVPVNVQIALGREVGEPGLPVPTSCAETEVHLMEPLARLAGGVTGPWSSALTHALAEASAAHVALANLGTVTVSHATHRFLVETGIDITLRLGRFSTRRWPITAQAIRLVPSLGPPDQQIEADAALTIRGNAYTPHLHAELSAVISRLAQFAVHDQVEALMVADVEATTPGASLLGPVTLTTHGNATLRASTMNGLENSGTATIDGRVRVPLTAMLNPDAGFRLATFDHVQLDTQNLRLERLRWARANNISGRMTLTARETGDAVTPLAVNVSVAELQVRTQRPMTASVNAFVRNNLGQWELQACTAMVEGANANAGCHPDDVIESAPFRGMRAGVTVPLQGFLLTFRPDVQGIQVALATESFPLESVSPLLEVAPIVRVGGNLTSHVTWNAQAPRAISGELHLVDGTVDLQRIGLPARDLTIDVAFQGRHANLSRLALQLGTGHANVHGHFDFVPSGHDVLNLALEATTRDFPAVQEGNLFAYITSTLGYEGTFSTSGHNGTLDIRSANVSVPTQSSRDLQDLEARPDVIILGETHIGTGQRSTAYPIDIDYNTGSPILARRDDFDIGLYSHGHIHYDAAGVALRGIVEQASRQSWVDLFGKRFYFDRVGIEFDGALAFNPVLDVAAHYDSPTAGRITLTVGGHYTNPEITFGAEQYPAASQSEILALLIVGRRDTQSVAGPTFANQAQDAAASLLTGILAGFGTTLARRQLDAMALPFVPRPIVEPGVGSEYRYGLGLTITSLPRLYIEGTYGTIATFGGGAADASGNRPVDFHGLAEYTLSEHWSTSVNVGTSGRAGVDLFYNYSP